MALVNLTSTPRIAYNNDIEYVDAVAIVDAYSTPGDRRWFDCGQTRFTAVRGFQYKFTQRIVYKISNVVCTSGMVLQVDARLLLFNETLQLEVPSSVDVIQGYVNFGGDAYGNLAGIFSFNASFKEGENELLIDGHRYTVRPQIEKEQSVGAPTCDVFVRDSVHDGGAAIRLNR